MALEEEDYLDHAHAPDQPHSCKNHLGNHEEARKPCVFKPHRDATKRHRGGAGKKEGSKTADGQMVCKLETTEKGSRFISFKKPIQFVKSIKAKATRSY